MIVLDTDWTAERKLYQLSSGLGIAEGRPGDGGVEVRFFDDHDDTARRRFSSTSFPSWRVADYAVLLIAEETQERIG